MRFPPVNTPTLITRICALLAVLLLAACAKSVDIVRIPADPALASGNWSRFVVTAKANETLAGPFRLNATLYYSGKEDSQRVTVYFWGNGDKNTPLPVRLDILVGSGSVAAKAGENAHGLSIYVPREGKVYFAENATLLAFDVPMPFSLKDIAFLVAGRFAEVFVPDDNTDPAFPPTPLKSIDNNVVYAVPGSSLGGQVTIGSDGLPVAWTDGNEKGWFLTIEYWPDSTRTLPRKLHIRQAEDREATLIVRELSYPDAPFTPEQLELALPSDTLLVPLADSH